ncbi:hypothetical protein DTO271D3_185 [Paecilomyces variotii]|nr:hypothetical protein DTO271D3_185 [Paecilomyces variotii]
MVLDDASPQADGFQSDNGSSDPFSRSVDPNSPFAKYYPLQVRQDLIYQPGLLGMYLTFFGRRNWERRFSEGLIERIENTKLVIQRYPTQQELDCFVESSSRGLYLSRLGLPFGLAAGVAHTLYQFREVKASPHRRIDLRAITEYFRLLAKSDPAFMRQFAFASAVRLFGWSITGLVLSSIYASYKSTSQMLVDPRLERLREEIRQQKPEDIQRRKIERVTDRHQQAQRAREGMKQGALAESQEQQSSEGDLSADSPGNNTYYGTGTTDIRESIPTPSQPNRQVYGDQATTSSSNGSSDFFDDDNASPTNPDYRMDDSSSSGAIGGSTWERIRQQNISGNAEQRRPQQTYRSPQQPNQTASDASDSYSSEERNRQRERELAQREFDRMVEAERKAGEDSPNTGNQNRGWGSWR